MLTGAFGLLRYAWNHPMGRQQRLRTLGRIGQWQFRSRLSPGPHEQPWVNGSRLIARRGDTGASGNIYFGLHEIADMALIAHLLRPGDVFVDGGANVGSYTVLAGAVAGATVHAFEPAAETVPKLRANIDANGLDAQIHQVALGAAAGKARFTRGQDSINRLEDTGEVEVDVAPLDQFSLSPTAIKLDLEGGELDALRGASATLAEPGLLAVEVETVADAAADILRSHGFERRWYDPFERTLHTTPTGEPNNQLWVRDADAVVERVRGGAVVTYGKIKV